MLPPRNRRIKVGLLGGSFNPAHNGHRYISVEALKHLGLDEIWWLVSPQNPLKPSEGMLPLEKRVAIAKKIVRHPKIRVTDLEKSFNTRYTRDTLLKIQAKFADIAFVWLMGSDNLEQFPQWYKWQDIAESIPIVVFARGNSTHKALRGKMASYCRKHRLTGRNIRSIAVKTPPVWGFLHVRKHPASATNLRKMLDNALINGYNNYIGGN